MKFNLFLINSNIIALISLIKREFIRIIRIWPQTILPPIITIILYFIVFGKILGNKIGYISGYQYIEYIFPGLLVMSIINNSYFNVSSSFFISKFQKYIEEIIISPILNIIVIIGFILGGIIRSFLVFLILFIISYLFFDIYIYNFYLILFNFLLTSILFSLLGFINAVFAKKFDDINIFPTFVLTPLLYFSGIFFSLELIPNFLKGFVYFNPLFYIVNLFRYSFLGISEINLFFSVFFLIFFLIFLYLFLIYVFYIGYEIKK